MALVDKLTERVTPLLEPGEQIQQIFLAQGGVNPWIAGMFGLLGQTMVKRRIIAATDRAVVVMSANFNGTKPDSVLARLPRSTKIGPTKGLWAPINLNSEKMWVAAKFRKDIEAADAVAVG